MKDRENEFEDEKNTLDFITKNKKNEDLEQLESKEAYRDFYNEDSDENDDEEKNGIIKKFIPDTEMFNKKNLKILGFVLVAMIFSFGVLPKFISDKKKKDKKAEEIAIANPEAMKVKDINEQDVDPNAMAEVNTPVETNTGTNPNGITDDQLPSYYNDSNINTGGSNDIPMDNISMSDIRSGTRQAYDSSEVNVGNAGNSRILDEINSGSSSNIPESRNNGNKKRGIEFVSNKSNLENVDTQQLPQNPAQSQLPQPPLAQPQDYDQNRQVSKQNFLNSSTENDFVSKKFLNRNYSKFELKTGHIIHGIMITGVNSDLPGQVLGQISQNVYDTITGKHLLIPMGTKIYGRYDSNVTYGQNRLLLVWQRLIFPNGYTLELENIQGVDLMGNAGFKGRVNNHFLKLLRSVLLSSVITAASSRLDNIDVNVNTGSRSRVSIGTGASAASEKIQSIGEKLVEKDLNRQPTIYVKKGYKFNIIVNKDLILVPYNQLRR